jgi:hypothetical protein
VRADIIRVAQKLSARHLRPAPLVPTTAPRSLLTLDATMELTSTRRRSAYAIGITNAFRGDVIDSVIFLDGGEYTSVRAALRDFRGYRVQSTRIRGHQGYLVRRGIDRTLLWVEGGRVYRMGSSTPKTVSLKELRAAAEGLDGLVGSFSGSDAGGEQEAFLAVTRRTFTADVTWSANCTAPNGSPAAGRAGHARTTLQPLHGADFSFGIAPNVIESDPPIPWQGTVSGAVGGGGATVNMRVTATTDGDSCDSGPVSLALRAGG